MYIVLIGYRGTGKSTIGSKLATLLHKKLVSTDELIVKKAGPIPHIVKKYGWKKFRDIEEKVISEVSKKDNILIDCGGGVVERPIKMTRCKKNGKVILLTANIKRFSFLLTSEMTFSSISLNFFQPYFLTMRGIGPAFLTIISSVETSFLWSTVANFLPMVDLPVPRYPISTMFILVLLTSSRNQETSY